MTMTVVDAELEELEEQEDEAIESGNLITCFSRCVGTENEEERLNDLKKEREIDWHTKPIEQLQADYGTVFVCVCVVKEKNNQCL